MNPNKRTKLRNGDHLVTPRVGYTHHGLYIGADQVIHYLQEGVVVSTLHEFRNGSHCRILNTKRRYSRDVSIKRAYTRLGEDKYDLATNNCEQFVNWCLNGEQVSEQVASVIIAASKIAPVVLAGKAPQPDWILGRPTTGPTVSNTSLATTAFLPVAANVAGTIVSGIKHGDSAGDIAKDVASSSIKTTAKVVLADTLATAATSALAKTALGAAIPPVGIAITTYMIADAVVEEVDIGAAAGAVLETGADIVIGTAEVVSDVASGTVDLAMRGVVGGIEVGSDILEFAGDVFSGTTDAVLNTASDIFDGVRGFLSDVFG
jgi:NC domain.